MRTWIEYRVVLSLAVSAITGGLGLHFYPFPGDDLVLGLIHLERPAVYAGLAYTYATLWFTTTFFLSSMGLSLLYIFVARRSRPAPPLPLPPYPAPEHRK